MMRPARDPHWCLGVEHGRDGREIYGFVDAENQRRYLLGYERGTRDRRARFVAACHEPVLFRKPPNALDPLAMHPCGVRKP